MKYLLGIDVGTTGTKTLIIDELGHIVASVTEEYPLYTPHAMWAEQDPEDWWEATVKSVRRALHDSGIDPNEIAPLAESVEFE